MIRKSVIAILFVILISASVYAQWTKTDEAQWKKLKNYIRNATLEEKNTKGYRTVLDEFVNLDARRYDAQTKKRINKLIETKIEIKKEEEERKNPKTYWIRARESYKKGDYADAIENIEMVRSLDPEDADATSFKRKINMIWHIKKYWYLLVLAIILIWVKK